MGQLVVTEFVTLDGVAQAPGAPEEDPENGFEFGGWQAPVMEAESGDAMFADARGMDALLLGRKTYDIFAGYWPTAPEEIPFTGLLNAVPKYVASRTLSEPLSWVGSSLLRGDVADAVAELKDRHDSIHLIGSLDLLRTLLDARLVDRVELWMYPIVLGGGKRVFEPGVAPTAFEVTESVTYPRGTVKLVLSPSGVPATGDMTVDEPHLHRG
jgi:dihydrofolate reductase